MDKDSSTVDPFLPLIISQNSDRITYVNFLLAPEELNVIQGVLQ